MSGTALYRALVSAGASIDEAKEASNAVENKFEDIGERLGRVELMIT